MAIGKSINQAIVPGGPVVTDLSPPPPLASYPAKRLEYNHVS